MLVDFSEFLFRSSPCVEGPVNSQDKTVLSSISPSTLTLPITQPLVLTSRLKKDPSQLRVEQARNVFSACLHMWRCVEHVYSVTGGCVCPLGAVWVSAADR